MKIAVATKNQGKLKEFKELASNTDYEFIHLPENIIDLPPETGSSFYENALIKAEFVSKKLGMPAIGDDSGLEVDALGGKPGIYSARYSESGTDQDNCLKLIKDMEPYETNLRSARFRCCLVGYFEGMIIKSYGSLEGGIATEFKGSQGFGYDPIFITKNGSHLAELSKKEKNKISHRSEAFKDILKELHKFVS
tara:strand:+ start:1723 stop:2304 length:582 start_codon:yes stop_codon:yes gene_type:complete